MRSFAIAAALLAFSVLATDASGARAGKRQLWGAIAYNSKSGAYGYAVDVKTKREAETEAFRQCGDCDVIKTFRDSCGVIADRPKKLDKPKKAAFVWEKFPKFVVGFLAVSAVATAGWLSKGQLAIASRGAQLPQPPDAGDRDMSQGICFKKGLLLE